MKRFSEKLKKQADSIRLTTVEKADLHARVVSFMEYHPLPAQLVKSKAAATQAGVRREAFSLISIPSQYFKIAAGAFVFLFVVGIPALAERAIPGDILYPIKVQVTEEIRGSLKSGGYEKVAWETQRLERRVSEARQLAGAGRLTPEIEAEVLEAVRVHQGAAENEIATLRTTDAEGATLAQLTLATALNIQSSVLAANDSASTTQGKSTVALAKVLAAGSKEMTDKGGAATVSIERLQAQLEIETTRSYELLKNIAAVATEQEQKDIKRRLSDLDTKMKTALNHAGNNPEDAKIELRAAWGDVQKLISFMTDIDVRASIAIETLVPVVMTDEERTVTVMKLYRATEANLGRITTGLPGMSGGSVANKITLTLPRVQTLLLTASTTLSTDIAGAQSAVTEAYELTQSILAMGMFPAVGDSDVKPSATTSTSTNATEINVDTLIDISTTTPASSTKEKKS